MPLRRSLLVRLLAASVLIALCSVTATAWLVARATTSAIQHQQGQTLDDDTTIYTTLVGYAAVHHDWSGVGPELRRLAQRTGRRITLTTADGRPLAGSSTHTALPTRASAVVDPLRVDPALLPGAGADRIDPRAVGPYRLPAVERASLRQKAGKIVNCMNDSGYSAAVGTEPSGRTFLVVAGDAYTQQKGRMVCAAAWLDDPTRTEIKALTQLNALVNACLERDHLKPVKVELGFSTYPAAKGPVQTCIDTGRHDQLTPYVAPAALLYITSGTGSATTSFHLSAAHTVPVAALVLLVTVAVTVTVGTRLVRPLRQLTAAARGPAEEHWRVPVSARDEIGYLAAAFNDLSERRERLEGQRKALASDVAHELRTPLSTIRSSLEAAQDGVSSPDPAFIASLLEEALLLQRVIDDLQDLAEADAGQLRLHPEAVYLRDLLDHVAAVHRGRAEAAGVRLTTWTEADPVVSADPVRLRQMVSNLVSNAVRHTPAGGSVTVLGRHFEDEVLVEVVDTGSGIRAEDLPHVFDRFWRAEKSRSRQTGGSGLGLAIVRQFTEAHGGTVAVTSDPGHETVFTLRLPG